MNEKETVYLGDLRMVWRPLPIILKYTDHSRSLWVVIIRFIGT
jgi:hypothetical protein